MNEMKIRFKPEFLNRVDEIIVFKQLDEKEIEKIVDLMLNAATGRLAERDIKVEVTEKMKKYIAKKGFDPLYGARPLRRAIQSLVEDKLAENLLDGKIKDGDKVIMDYDKDEVKVEVKK